MRDEQKRQRDRILLPQTSPLLFPLQRGQPWKHVSEDPSWKTQLGLWFSAFSFKGSIFAVKLARREMQGTGFPNERAVFPR